MFQDKVNRLRKEQAVFYVGGFFLDTYILKLITLHS